MKHIIALLLALLVLLSLCSCNSAEQKEEFPQESTESQNEAPVITEADPQTALEEIYAQLDRHTGLVDADAAIVSDVMGFDMKTIDEYYIRYMETDFGASDVYIIKAKNGKQETVCQALKDWQESRIRSFSGYDIYNSTEISENAVIFTRGEYLIMLMLEDNEAARSIIEQYIPEELNLEN
jgi:hypothetical protein